MYLALVTLREGVFRLNSRFHVYSSVYIDSSTVCTMHGFDLKNNFPDISFADAKNTDRQEVNLH